MRFGNVVNAVRAAFGENPPQLVIVDGPKSRMRWGAIPHS
jgi:hypothetical protein